MPHTVTDPDQPPMDRAEPVFISTKETARLLGVSLKHIYDLLDEQVIESRYLGHRRLVVLASLRTFIAGLPSKRPEAADKGGGAA